MAIPVKTDKFFVGCQLEDGSIEFMEPEQMAGCSFYRSKAAAREERACHARHGYTRKELGVYRVTEFRAEKVK